MATLQEIEKAVLGLSAEEMTVFRAWFADLEADAWDRQIAADAASGRLDAMADEALADLRANRCTER